MSFATAASGVLKRFLLFLFFQKKLWKKCCIRRIRYLEKDEVLFRQGQAAETIFYISKEGASYFLTGIKSKSRGIRDECDEGDSLGFWLYLESDPMLLSAKVQENSLVYAIPGSVFEEVLEAKQSSSPLFCCLALLWGQVVIRTGPFRRTKSQRRNLKTNLGIIPDDFLWSVGNSKFSEVLQTLGFRRGVFFPEQTIQPSRCADRLKNQLWSSIRSLAGKISPIGNHHRQRSYRSKSRLPREIPLHTVTAQVMHVRRFLTRRRDASFSDLYIWPW